jgi:hypothetical protein
MQTHISLRDKVFHNYSYFLQESTNSSKSSRAKHLRVVQLESMPGYKYPNIDSGATPIGSAGRAPGRKSISRKNSTKRRRKGSQFEPMIDYKYPTIASGATPVRSAGRAPDEELLQEERGRKFRVHCRWQAPENELDISLPSGEQIQEPDYFGHCI